MDNLKMPRAYARRKTHMLAGEDVAAMERAVGGTLSGFNLAITGMPRIEEWPTGTDSEWMLSWEVVQDDRVGG